MAAVSLQNIEKSFDGQIVLDGLSLDLHKGEKVGLIGANGSGKTTIFKLIMGIEQPDRGTMTITRGISVGYLPQEPQLPPEATLIEAVGEVFTNHRRMEADLAELSH